MSRIIVDITNQRFGRLLVISQAGRDKWGQVKWLCHCDCGAEVIALSANLRKKNHTLSCGCHRDAALAAATTTHGHTRQRHPSREYRSWQGMKKRCLDAQHIHFKNYGGRGIRICERWLNSFENFLEDMGERPPNRTLDRIDNEGNYEPSNCRWATPLEQARNKRKRRITL